MSAEMWSRFCPTALANFLVHCTLAAGFWQRSPSSIKQQMSSTSGLFGLPLELILILKRAQRNNRVYPDIVRIRNDRLRSSTSLHSFSFMLRFWNKVSKITFIFSNELKANFNFHTASIVTWWVWLKSELCIKSPHSVQIWTCNGGPRQQWTMNSQTQEVKLKSDGSCLDITDWSTDNGANIYIYTCHPDNQPQNQQVSSVITLLVMTYSYKLTSTTTTKTKLSNFWNS